LLSRPTSDRVRLPSLLPAIFFEFRVCHRQKKLVLSSINQGAASLLGLDPATFDAEKFSMENFTDLIHPDDCEAFIERLIRHAGDDAGFREQFRLLLPGERIRCLDAIGLPETLADGDVVWRGLATDVTPFMDPRSLLEPGYLASQGDRMGAAYAPRLSMVSLLEENERWRATLQAIGDAVISTDIDRHVTFMNAAAEHMTEWSQSAALGQSLDRVLKFIDRRSGGDVPNPVDRSLGGFPPPHISDGTVLLTPSGKHRDVQDSVAHIRAESGEIVGAVLVLQDVSQSRALLKQLAHSAGHDAMTGLPNRAMFERTLTEARAEARAEHRAHVLCIMDLDRFKIVNDSAGHTAGDAFLREIATCIQSACRTHDFTARLGGDEFGLILYDCSLINAKKKARALLDEIGEIRFSWNGEIYDVGASIGLTAITDISPPAGELMSQADVACDAAKAAGRNQAIVYGVRRGAAQRHHQQIQIASGIRGAIESNRFMLFAQEILSLAGRPSGKRMFEVLLRMKDPSGRILRPMSFIPAAERYDLMGRLDRWVIGTTLIERGKELLALPNVSLSINLSANSINDPLFWPFLHETLERSVLPPDRVHFEITETAIINNLALARGFMSAVRDAGYGLILDDFGTGLSSFAYLKEFPVDRVKIDGSFIRQLKKSPVDRVIVESINEIGHKLGARTIAEFVEDAATLEIIRSIGIDQAQGYAISRPLPLDFIIGAGGPRRKPRNRNA